jgi:hypothetical protein
VYCEDLETDAGCECDEADDCCTVSHYLKELKDEDGWGQDGETRFGEKRKNIRSWSFNPKLHAYAYLDGLQVSLDNPKSSA